MKLKSIITKFKSVNNKCGFSMVEAMITVAIFSMMITALYQAFNVGDASWKANFAKMSLQQELRKGMDFMQYELREAGRDSIVGLTEDVASSSLTFQIPEGITGGEIDWADDQIVYSVSSNQLQRVQDATTKILANDINSVSFLIDSSTPNILEVSLSGQRTTTAGLTVSQTMSFKVTLRN